MLKIRLIGPNASYLARRWFERGKVDWSDGTDLVQLHEKPDAPGAEAFWQAYLRDLAADGRGLSVDLRFENGSILR
jgi:hypothetical protein